MVWLRDVPTHKIGIAFIKPVDPVLGQAIDAWRAVRPGQPRFIYRRTGEQVNLLFAFRARRAGPHASPDRFSDGCDAPAHRRRPARDGRSQGDRAVSGLSLILRSATDVALAIHASAGTLKPVIKTLRPKDYDEALNVGHFFRKGVPVLMDLTQLTDDVARQMVDFCAGLICGRGGEMERLDRKVFLLQPPARPRIAAAHIPDLAHVAD